jgi:hypothetical protein
MFPVFYAENMPATVKKNHIQGHHRVLHPHAAWCFVFPKKEHASITGQPAPKHESTGALGSGQRQFHRKGMIPSVSPANDKSGDFKSYRAGDFRNNGERLRDKKEKEAQEKKKPSHHDLC